MPKYRFLTRRPGTLEGEIIEADFVSDEAAVEDARHALADAAHDAAVEHTKFEDEIEVTDAHGVVIATVALNTEEHKKETPEGSP